MYFTKKCKDKSTQIKLTIEITDTISIKIISHTFVTDWERVSHVPLKNQSQKPCFKWQFGVNPLRYVKHIFTLVVDLLMLVVKCNT